MTDMQHSCEKEIQEAKLRVTPARVAMMQLFESHDKPLDGKHLIDHLQQELGIDRVTVFRILNAFVERGLIRKITLGENKARYELNTHDHHHLVCESCGDIQDISDCNIDILESHIEKKKQFKVTSHSLEFFGLCRKCQEKTN